MRSTAQRNLKLHLKKVPFKIPLKNIASVYLVSSIQSNFLFADKAGKKGKKKGSDSDSDEDWGKNKKAPGTTAKKGGGGKGKGGGYTRAITLSPELAAIVGAEQMARHEVVKKVWSIIKERNLYVSIFHYLY